MFAIAPLKHTVIQFHLESIAWDCSKEGWKSLPITQAGTCGKMTHLKRDIQYANRTCKICYAS